MEALKLHYTTICHGFAPGEGLIVQLIFINVSHCITIVYASIILLLYTEVWWHLAVWPTHPYPSTATNPSVRTRRLCWLSSIILFYWIPAGSDHEHWKTKMEKLSSWTLWLLGRTRGREEGGKASGFPASLTAWREGCCQFRLLPCWKKVEVTRGPPGRQPGTRNSIELPPKTGLFWRPFPWNCFAFKKKKKIITVQGQFITRGLLALLSSKNAWFAQKDFHFPGCSTTSLTHNKYTHA